MSEVDKAGSTARFWCFLLAFLAVAGIGFAVALAVWPDMMSMGAGRIVGQVAIAPQDAVNAGGQWRLVSQWQAAGEMQEAENLYLVEFRPIPGWEAPAPVVLGKGRSRDRVEGVYIPVQYAEKAILTLSGSSTMANRVVPELARHYLQHLGADEVRLVPGKAADDVSVQGIFYSTREIRTIEVRGRGTPSGFMDLKDGLCDLAMAVHRLSPVDSRSFGQDVITAESEHRLGMDAVSVIVHRDNPVKSLTVEDVGKIFAGEITDWSQVGGPSAKINVYALRDNFGTRGFFESIFLGSRQLSGAVRDVETHSMLPELVSQDIWGIGFCSLALAGPCREMPLKAKSDGEAVLPNAESIRSLAYPASRSLYLYVRADSRNVYARDFVGTSLSEAGQSILGKYGFVKLQDISGSPAAEIHISPSHKSGSAVPSIFRPGAPSVLRAPAISGPLPPLPQLDGEVVTAETRKAVLQEFQDGVYGAERLPFVFRFQASSLEPDQQAIQHVSRVADMMQEPGNAGKAVILVGFSDSVGAYESNLAVARKRAETIAERLQTKGVRNVIVLAAGEEGATDPNESRVGRERNRRVEIWLK
jgi:phosphate transport system substrate-binding protein